MPDNSIPKPSAPPVSQTIQPGTQVRVPAPAQQAPTPVAPPPHASPSAIGSQPLQYPPTPPNQATPVGVSTPTDQDVVQKSTPTPSVVPPAAPPAAPPTSPPAAAPTPPPAAPPVRPPASVGALSSLSSSQLPPQAQQKATTQSTPTSPPKVATPKKSILRFLPFILGGVALLGVVIFVLTRIFGGESHQSVTGGASTGSNQAAAPASGPAVTLEYWGLWEPTEVMSQVIADFEKDNPEIKVRYTKQSHRDYRERLQTAIASGNGPDLFRFHASWAPMLKNELAPLPSSIMTTSDFQSTFYPVAYQQLQQNGQIVGIPLMYDGLALYYNKKIFEETATDVPTTWVELKNTATKLTVRQGSTIQRAGLAMGNTKNVEHFSDILAVLLLQNGADMRKPNSPETRDALLFYTNFFKTDKVWSEALPTSSVAFARGDVAMIFAPSWRAHEIMAMNPDLEFATAPLPRLADERIAWASYWAEGVNSKNAHKNEAWKLIEYLSRKDIQQKLYAEQSKTRRFGELYSRVDLADELADDPVAQAYLLDAPHASGWYISSNTFDRGINDQLIKYYEDAINAVLEGKSMESILQTLDLGTTQVLRQYSATGTP